MNLFTSQREKRFWLWSCAVVVTIFSSLLIQALLAGFLRNDDIQTAVFVFGMMLVTASVVVHGLNAKPSRTEMSVLLGIIAVYVLLVLRLGVAERSHLMEYSVLAILIHKALVERREQKQLYFDPALLSWVMACLIGVLDECIQILLPNRVFDPRDMLFNGVAVTMALGASLLLRWTRMRMTKND